MSDDSCVDLRVRVTDIDGRAVQLNGNLSVFYERYDDGRLCLPIPLNVNHSLGSVGSLRNTRDTVGLALTVLAGHAETIIVYIALLIEQEVITTEAVTFVATPGSWESAVSIRYR